MHIDLIIDCRSAKTTKARGAAPVEYEPMTRAFSARGAWFPKTLSLVALILTTCITVAETISGQVASVADGDTLSLVDVNQRRRIIRLAGIDAPEKLQEFGPQAKQQLTQFCLGKKAQAQVRTTDRYGRTVARVSCEGVDVAALMLEKGMAWHFSRYASTQPGQESDSDKAAQTLAKTGRVGLWGMPEPIAPWDWRANHRDLDRKQ